MHKTHSSQPLIVVLLSSDVVAGGDQLVIHTGDVAADPSHLGGDADRTLMALRLLLCCLDREKHRDILREQRCNYLKDIDLKKKVILNLGGFCDKGEHTSFTSRAFV